MNNGPSDSCCQQLLSRLILAVGIVLSTSLWLSGQTITVSGVVTSAEDDMTLIGVNVIEQNNASNGTISDIDGSYSLTLPADGTLEFSYVGYETLTVPVEGRTSIDVTLTQSANLLDDVVVTGYRREIKSDMSAAIASIEAKDIENLPVLGIDQALQGQVAGVQITQATGAPGDDIAVRIRGAGTIGNNNPLFIIDGVPTTGNINMFSTNDIESIQVLKDAAAASIYGARAANGVVVITTKKGKSGKPTITFDAYTGWQETVNLPELLNAEEYLSIRNEAITNANMLRDERRQLDTYDPAILDTLPDVDWLDEVFNPAPIQRYTLSATGGGESGNYYVMGEYLNQDGVFRGQGFEKYLLRFNGEIGGSKRVRIGNNISISYTDRDIIGSSGDGAGAGNELSGIRYALIAAPVYPIRYDNGDYINTSTELADPLLFGDGNANPLAFVDATNWNQQRYRIFGNVYLAWDIVEGLNFQTNLGGDLLFQNEKLFKERLSAAIYDPSSLTESRVFDQNLIWNNLLNFNRTFGVHRVSGLLGMEAIKNTTNFMGASANNFFRTDPLFRYLDNSITEEISNVGVSGIETEWALMSFFGQVGYSFDNRYVLNLSVRRDGSSRFGEQNRYGVFPSVSAAWNISNEPFFRDIDLISGLKLRASWGQLGNQNIGVYPFASLVETGRRVYSFGDQVATGARLVEIGNQNIRWETTTQTNFGLEFSLFNDRISVAADYYRKLSSDILVRVPVPQAGGAQSPPFVNAGEVENRGLEVAITYQNRIGELSYSVSGNIATVRNEVLSLADSEPILGGFGLSDGPITKTEPGFPIGSFFLYQSLGLFQTQEEIDASAFQSPDTRPGDVRFADLNSDGIIDGNDRAHLGNPFPDFTYGLNLNVNYKNFDLSILAQGVQGNDVYFLYGNFAYEAQARGFNSYRDILNRWTPNNRNTNIPKVSTDDRNGNRRISTRFLEDGSYLRIRNITLGYNFTDLIQSEFMQNLRLYLQVQNAFTFTSYPGLDPEIQANANDTDGFNVSSDLAVGIDWGTVPAPRIFTAGVRVEF